MRKTAKWILIWGILGFLGTQLIPVERSNPAVTNQPRWDSPETEAIARRACYDCHSNETTWPWYSYVAPVSWRVVNHVNDGRKKFNISTGKWDEADEISEFVSEGKMPLWDYLMMHPEARLTSAEKQALITGMQKTFGGTNGKKYGFEKSMNNHNEKDEHEKSERH